MQQKRLIRGIVKDEKGITLPGVSVIVKGTQTGVATDINGRFEIKVDDEPNLILQFSFVGMKTKEIKIGNNQELKVVLESAAESLDEVIVTGYQTISKERTTGSFGVITPRNIETKLQSNLSSVLEGQATGVVLDKDGKIEIRGVSTFNAENEPLVVLDGYPIEGGLESINPENIENITVLKDGVAASIYGSRAANGVIVVTTTRGAADRFNVSYKGIVSTILKPQLSKLNRASTSDYIDAELDLYYQNPNRPSTQSVSNMSKVTWLMMQAREGNMTEAEALAEIDKLRNINGLKQAEKYFYRNQLSHQHNIAINGGTEKNRFNAAVNYMYNRGNMIHSDNSRLIFDLKNDWKPSKYISLGLMANVVYTKDEHPVRGWSDLLGYTNTSLIQPYDNLVDPETGKSYQQRTNPDGTRNAEDEEKLRRAIRSFLRTLRRCNPNAHLLWAYGMLGAPLEDLIRGAVETYAREEGDARAHFFLLPMGPEDGMGARNHPGLAMHERAAQALAERIRAL